MITAGDFRNGVTFEMDGQVMQVVEFQHVKPGKGAAFVRTKMKNVITGAVTETSFNPTAKFENATVDRMNMEYSYADGNLYYFMNPETYELEPVDESALLRAQVITDIDQSQVIIAVPVTLSFQGNPLSVCFMAIDMSEMLAGVSMDYQSSDTTFSNLYTGEGVPLTNQMLGGQASRTNLLEALEKASFEKGYSLEQVKEDFAQGRRGIVSFDYNGIPETLSYAPVGGTNWLMTYLIRESVIDEQINTISRGIITRSVAQSLLTVLVLMGMFFYIIQQNKKTAHLQLEKETADTEHRIKQEEMEHRLALQEELLSQKEQGQQQNRMIRALSSDYRSVYYLELDKNSGVCYQERTDLPGFKAGESFPYLEAVTAYCNQYVMEPYREEFLKFIQPDAVRKGLEENLVISYRYMISVNGRESWEIVKFAGVRHPETGTPVRRRRKRR